MAQNNAKIHGLTSPAASFVGKDLIWIANDSDLSNAVTAAEAIRSVQQLATVMIIGEATADGLILAIEGPTEAPAGWTQVAISGVSFVS
jgi:hypothetical protein